MAIEEEVVPHAYRLEEDALGDVQVPAEHLWGAQTQRSHLNFPIGVERFRWGMPVIRALGILKKCAALANGQLGQLSREKVDLIVRAAQEVIDGRRDDELPLVVFQTGSGAHRDCRGNRESVVSCCQRITRRTRQEIETVSRCGYGGSYAPSGCDTPYGGPIDFRVGCPTRPSARGHSPNSSRDSRTRNRRHG